MEGGAERGVETDPSKTRPACDGAKRSGRQPGGLKPAGPIGRQRTLFSTSQRDRSSGTKLIRNPSVRVSFGP